MQTIHTDRLTFKPYTQQDLDAARAIFGDKENARFLMLASESEVETMTMFEKALIAYDEGESNEYAYTTQLCGSEKPVGVCIIGVDESGSEAELGWAMDKDYWRRGLGTLIARTLINFGFEQLNLRRIYAVCDSENVGSYRVMEKSGMRREGHFVKTRFSREGYRDELYYAILREEWEEQME